MKKIINLPLEKDLAAVSSYAALRDSALNMRAVALSNCSGYPLATQVVGKIQREFKLTSYKDLLDSIIKIRNISLVAAEVINTIPVLKVDRYQLERTEIDEYIKSMTKTSSGYTFTESDRGLIAFMITSSESSEHSWLLDMAENEDNLFIKLQKLYDSLFPGDPYIENGELMSAPSSVFSYYEPSGDKIQEVQENPRIKTLLKDVIGRGKKGSAKAILEADKAIKNTCTLNSICAIRVVDHIWSLLTSQELWGSFITPRTSIDPSLNLERANGLQLFASYLHSILMYSSIFQTELFMHVYNRLGNWVTTFPALPAELLTQYEAIVKKHDYLNASADALSVINSLDEQASYDCTSNIHTFPSQSLTLFGLDDIITKITNDIKPVFSSLKVSDLKDLTSNDYSYVLLSQPVSEYNMIYPLTETLLIGGAVKIRLGESIAGLIPGIPRFFSHSQIDSKLRRLGLNLPFPIGYQTGLITTLTYATEIIVRNGVIPVRSRTPIDSYEWKEYIRKKKNMSLLTHSVLDDKYLPKFVFDADKAAKLRSILEEDWKGMLPTSLVQGDIYYTHALLKSDDLLVKDLFETISGQSFEWITRTISNPYLREKWATFLSSWCTLFVNSDKTGKLDLGDVITHRVNGKGMPYGKDYEALHSIQKTATSIDDFIKITDGVYIKMHNVIPTPSRNLAIHPDFYLLHPYYYYQGNSTMEVSRWIITEGLLNFTCVPIHNRVSEPLYFLNKRYAFINESLYLQTNPMFTPSKFSYSGASVPLSKREWNRERHRQWIELIVPGSYGSSAVSRALDISDAEQVADTVKKMEAEIAKVESSSPQNNLEKAPIAVISSSDVNTEMTIKDKSSSNKSKKGKNKKEKSKSDDVDKTVYDEIESEEKENKDKK